jgi:hypothetical protein
MRESHQFLIARHHQLVAVYRSQLKVGFQLNGEALQEFAAAV